MTPPRQLPRTGDGSVYHSLRMPVVDVTEPRVGADVPCTFEDGFAAMRDQLQSSVAVDCVESARPDPSGNGDLVQGTIDLNARTLGYMSWEQATSSMRWYDGQIVYTFNQCGLQARADEARFAWELDPSLLEGGVQPGACEMIAAHLVESYLVE